MPMDIRFHNNSKFRNKAEKLLTPTNEDFSMELVERYQENKYLEEQCIHSITTCLQTKLT
jgi:hypothetical protein